MKPRPTFREEIRVWKAGFNFVIGVDEVGRGAFGGPVTVGAVVFDKDTAYPNSILSQVNDSKLLTPIKRLMLSKEIKKHARVWNVTTVGVSTINKKGIGKATQMAFRKAVKNVIGNLSKKRHSSKVFLLVDGFHIRYLRGFGFNNQKAIVKGDQKSISIAAASIIAKVHRDNLMRRLHKKFPVYNFAKNKGYGTKEHREAIKKYGLSAIHRTSFSLERFTTQT